MSSNLPAAFVPVSDLAACEREPIHIPSAIEPNGALLVLHEPALAIVQASSNILPFLGVAHEDLLKMVLGDIFSPADVQRLVGQPTDDGKRRYVHELQAKSGKVLLTALAHRYQGLLIVELETSTSGSKDSEPDIYAELTEAMAELDGPMPLENLCQRIASRVRRVTSFDRVMVYRFLKDDSGSVIAEDTREDLIPYLGLRYPASDIPPQARRLYLLNMLRLKADVNAQSAALIPAVNPITGVPLDMTFCILRAMSPVHVEYLRNMGVAASMSISIVKEGRLWGLIACHHGSAKLVPHPMRITCEVLASVFSSHISAAEALDDAAYDDALREVTARLEARLRADRDVAATLRGLGGDVSSVLDAQGCVLNIGNKLALLGKTPDLPHTKALLGWLDAHQHEHVFTTERIAELYPDAADSRVMAGGLLSVRIALGEPDFIVWLRPAVIQEVTWAGNPEKPVEETEAGRRISPRLSFEQWKQTFRDRSIPWSDKDREFANVLRPLIAETLLLERNEEIGRLNSELGRSNADLQSFAYTASHDLQEPLRTMRTYAQMVTKTAGAGLSPQSTKFLSMIEDGAGRMAKLISSLLTYSTLAGKQLLESKPVDLEAALRQALTDLDEQVAASSSVVTHDVLPVVNGNFDHMVQLVQNLIGNAIKYGRPDEPPRIHVSCRGEGDSFLLSVSDNGQGFDPKYAEMIFGAFKRLHGKEVPGNGIGLATCKRIIDLYNGRIWAESAGKNQGATIWFTLPRASAKAKASGERDS